MAEQAKNIAVLGKARRTIPEPETMEDALLQRLRTSHDLEMEIARRVQDGMVVSDKSGIGNEFANVYHMLGKIFLEAAERGNAARLLAFVENRFPVNYQDPDSEEYALHIIAANGARRSLRALMSTGRCAYFVYDKRGRLPSELAYLYGEDIAMARLLAIKEKNASVSSGRVATHRPSPRRS